MEIHVVRPGDTIQSIAQSYGISEATLIRDNGLEDLRSLVIGQSIVIAPPAITYTVKEGDSLISIANAYGVSVMELLMNNPFLANREYLYPGDVLIISYDRKGKIIVHANTIPYISRETLRKTLPYLTYLSVLNYTATTKGEIITYYDDTEIINTAKAYGVIPIMLLTTLTLQGEANIGITYDILLNEDFQNTQIENILQILREKGYYGVNLSFQYVNISNLQLYENYLSKMSQRLGDAGYLVFVTIDPDIRMVQNVPQFERLDYNIVEGFAQNLIFMNYQWASNVNPPLPIFSIYNLNVFLSYITETILTSKLIIGMATIGYDWELPYSTGISSITSLTLDRSIELARISGSVIRFDEVSQTPYFRYSQNDSGATVEHVVWFIDARSINALLDLIEDYQIAGTGIWNITIYNTTLWLVINSQYEIVKLL